jgi:hypothetical protein
MVARVDELSRLKLRIADFERRIAEARENAGPEGQPMGRTERDQVLHLLVSTLEAMRTRRAALDRTNQGS